MQDLIDSGVIVVGGARVAKSRRVEEGESIELRGTPMADAPPEAEAVDVVVVYEDADVVVVAKPVGLVVHPGAGNEHGTLVSGLLARYPEIVDVGDRVPAGHRAPARPRDERVVGGRTIGARVRLARRAARRARGSSACTTRSSGACRTLGAESSTRRSGGRRRGARGWRCARKGDRRALRTTSSRRGRRPSSRWLSCRLETGRTHQIRVHMDAIGHPIVGDASYRGVRDSIRLRRPFLHARRLAFDHPGSGERVSFDEPLPADLTAVLRGLGPAD